MSVTEDIKARLDIVSLISQYVPLKKAGRYYKAPCPFHNERTPSFTVNPDTQTWHCFGACGDGGDIFNFVMKQEGLDFRSALGLLAERAGVQLQEYNTAERADHDKKLDKLRGVLQEAAHFFHDKLLTSREAEAARIYARKRGLKGETITQFSIGYAPQGWHTTLDHLRLLGYSEEEIIEAGVAIKNDEGRVYDRFRNRLVIPICDWRGHVIGFGARALNPDDEPKYLNSPQTPLFDKSATLFGLHHARRTIRENETAVIVEGYMDAIQAHQAGFTNVVAEMGTALTEPQLKQLSKFARRLILALDPDNAGMKATMRGLNVARQALGDLAFVFDPRGMMRQGGKLGIEILVMTLPESQDPDDLIREQPDAWRSLIESAQPVADYVIAMGTVELTSKSTMGEREQVARELLPILLATENDLQQNYNIQRLALKLHIDERTLIQWSQRHQPKVTQPARQKGSQAKKEQPPKEPVQPTQPGLALERRCLATLIGMPELYYAANRRLREIANEVGQTHEAFGPLSNKDFSRSDYQMLFDTLEQALAQDDDEPVEYLHQHLPYDIRAEVEALLVEPITVFAQNLRQALQADFEHIRKEQTRTAAPVRPDDELIQHILELRKQHLKQENQELQFLQQDTDIDMSMEYAHRVSINKLAIGIIEKTLSQVVQLQRDRA